MGRNHSRQSFIVLPAKLRSGGTEPNRCPDLKELCRRLLACKGVMLRVEFVLQALAHVVDGLELCSLPADGLSSFSRPHLLVATSQRQATDHLSIYPLLSLRHTAVQTRGHYMVILRIESCSAPRKALIADTPLSLFCGRAYCNQACDSVHSMNLLL